MKTFGALLMLLAVCACSAPVDLSRANAAVVEFHRRQAANDDQGIYSSAAPAFRNAATLSDLARLNDAARAAIARGCSAPPSDPTTWNVFYGTGGQRITVVYTRSCNAGDLTETFVLAEDQGVLKLYGYNIAGMALFPTGQQQPPTATSTATTSAAPEPTSSAKSAS
jgi:hypothetical protein